MGPAGYCMSLWNNSIIVGYSRLSLSEQNWVKPLEEVCVSSSATPRSYHCTSYSPEWIRRGELRLRVVIIQTYVSVRAPLEASGRLNGRQGRIPIATWRIALCSLLNCKSTLIHLLQSSRGPGGEGRLHISNQQMLCVHLPSSYGSLEETIYYWYPSRHAGICFRGMPRNG